MAINGTHMVIGEVQWVRLPAAVIHPDGYIDIEMAGTVAISGLDSYHLSERRCRLHYAKPDLPPRKML